MALPTRDALLNLGYIQGVTSTDLLQFYNYTVASKDKPKFGQLVFTIDSFGLRIFRAGRVMQSGGMTKGNLAKRAALVTSTITGAAGQVNDTTHAAATGAFTVNNEEGKVFQINVAAATAREGQAAFIVSNNANQLVFDPQYPLSASPVVADTFSDWGAHHWINATLAAIRIDVGGIIMSQPDTLGQIAWFQIYGVHPAATVDPAAIVANTTAIAGASGVRARGVQTAETYIGFFPMATSGTAVQAMVFIDLWTAHQVVA